MKRLLLIPILLLTSCSFSEKEISSTTDQKTAEFCLKATDFAGCVETLTKGLDNKRKDDINDGLRTWTRDTGVIVRMRTESIKAIKPNGEYGRYLQWNYSRTGEGDDAGSSWRAEGDCKEYTVNWEGDSYGWVPVREIEYLLANDRKANKHGGKWTYEPAREAQSVLNEFCSQMDRLVDEAKQKDL